MVEGKLLIIDDELLYGKTYVAFFKKRGLVALYASTAQEGLDFLDEHNDIDVVILDMFLPENNGLTVLQYLQSYSDWQKIPVILFTSASKDRFKLDSQQWLDYGVVEFVEKSEITPQEMFSLVAKILEDKST